MGDRSVRTDEAGPAATEREPTGLARRQQTMTTKRYGGMVQRKRAPDALQGNSATSPAAADHIKEQPASEQQTGQQLAGEQQPEATPEEIIPNDEKQQAAVMPPIDPGVLFDQDAELVAFIDGYAALWAEKLTAKTVKEVRAARVREARKAAQAQLNAMKPRPNKKERSRILRESEQVVEAPDPAVVAQELQSTMLERFRERFIERGGDILQVRSSGTRPRLLAKLRREENLLVRRMRKASPAERTQAIRELRAHYQQQYQEEIELAKQRFRLLVENQFRFSFEAQKAVSLAGFARPEEGREPMLDTEELEGVVDAKPGNKVAQSVVNWLKDLKSRSPISFSAGTYKSHSWGEYSVDVFVDQQKQDERGFYRQQQVLSFFQAVEDSAQATKVEWRALYNDFDVAKKVNETLGTRKVGFQWHHGPAPYVLHIHFDIMPLALPELPKPAPAATDLNGASAYQGVVIDDVRQICYQVVDQAFDDGDDHAVDHGN